MPPARFCLEETSLRLPQMVKANLRAKLAALLDMIDLCRGEGQQICRYSELEKVEIQPGLSVANLLYSVEINILDHDFRQRLRLAIDRCLHWDADDELAVTVQQPVKIDGRKEEDAPTVAFVHAQRGAGRALACMVLLGGAISAGKKSVTTGGQTFDIYFIETADDTLRCFYRDAIEIEDMDRRSFVAHAALAFPELYLVPGLEQQFNAFAQSYQKIRPEVVIHMAMLNDHFREIFVRHKGQPTLIQREIKSKFNIRLSTESPKTRANKQAARERRVRVGEDEIACEWHTKLDYRSGRIHFHPGSMNLVDGKIVIGILADHLST